MIEELEVIRSIVSQLSGAGLWFGLAYIGYLILSKTLLYGVIVFFIYKLGEVLVKINVAPVSVEEFSRLKNKLNEAEEKCLKKEQEKTDILYKYETIKNHYEQNYTKNNEDKTDDRADV